MSMMDNLSFDEFEEQLRKHLSDVREERDLRAFKLPDILGDEDYIRFLTIEYNFTDRVN